MLRFIVHILAFIILTVFTQIGGVLYLISVLVFSKRDNKRRGKRLGLFTVLYLLCTLLIIPGLAPMFGREKIKNTDNIEAHTFFTILTNRNYVRPEMNLVLEKVSIGLSQKYKNIKLVYLDANFPFLNGFPLLPHRSHNDGKKVDLSFVYSTQDDEITNDKKSMSGYGVYEGPMNGEYNQIIKCKAKGFWQYDFTKYLTFGKMNKELALSENATRYLVNSILKEQSIGKIFIEPHLKTRLNLSNNKVRFHGCGAVRHDDHIHIELR